MGKEVSQRPLLVLADDGQGELNELGPSLGRGTVGRRDVVKILLGVHKGEVELPELLRGDTGNLRKGVMSHRSDLIPPKSLLGPTANATSWTKVEAPCHG